MKNSFSAALRKRQSRAHVQLMIIHVYRKSVRVLSPTSYVIEPTGRFRNEMEKESGKAERSLNQIFPLDSCSFLFGQTRGSAPTVDS